MFRKTFAVLGLLATLTMTACGPSPQQQAQNAAYQQGVAAGQAQAQQAAYPQSAAAPTQQQAYNTIAECQSDPNNPNPQLCQQSFTQAQAALPHYYSAGACSALYQNCQDYGGWFGPAFAGFMLGSYLNGGYHPYPLYLGAGGYIWGNGYSLGYRPVTHYYGGVVHYGVAPHTVLVIHSTPSTAYRSAVPAAAYTHTVAAPPPVQRGGFGATQARAGMTAARAPGAPVAGTTLVSATRPGAAPPAYRPAAAPAPVFRPSASPAPRSVSSGFHASSGGFRKSH